MSNAQTIQHGAPKGRLRRWHILFRGFAVGLVLLFGGTTELWKSILTPWILFADTSDHGWPRTAELHRVGDTASAALLAMVTAGALLSCMRPRTQTAVSAWVAFTLMIIAAGQVWSTVVQEHTDLVGALFAGGFFLVLTAVPYVLLHPRRRDVLRGGASDPYAGPKGPMRALLWGLLIAGVVLAAAVTIWRITGGTFEDPREDDAVGLAMLGMTVSFGCVLCLKHREGWATLTALLISTAAYCAIAGLSLAT